MAGRPLPNRVDPFGALHAVPERGRLHRQPRLPRRRRGRFVRHHRGNLWITCCTGSAGGGWG